MARDAGNGQLLGHQYAIHWLERGSNGAREAAVSLGTEKTFDSFERVQEEDLELAFLHSALCAMSLPAKRPEDETKPIIREDGKYALAINPKPVLQVIDGRSVMRSLGVPFGSYPRVALIYLLSEAVKRQCRDVYLGRNFTEWMRRLGYQTISYGPRGSANLLKEQVDRLLACEWQIRWDDERDGQSAFAVKEVKISNEYAGSLSRDGEFAREIRLSEVFYKHLVDHAVPLNEVAIRELKNQPTALDLYTYLAYRLPRVTSERGQAISWEQLAKHLGNDSDGKKFRQTVRRTMSIVSAVYPNARVDLGARRVMLYPSPAPTEKKLVGPHLRLVGSGSPAQPQRLASSRKEPRSSVGGAETEREGPVAEQLGFPAGSLHFGERGKRFLEIGRRFGGGWDVDDIAGAYRKAHGDKVADKPEREVLVSWLGFVKAYAERRGSAA